MTEKLIHNLRKDLLVGCFTTERIQDYLDMLDEIETTLKDSKKPSKYFETKNGKQMVLTDGILSIQHNYIEGTCFNYRLVITYTSGQKVSLGYKTETDQTYDFNLLKEVLK